MKHTGRHIMLLHRCCILSLLLMVGGSPLQAQNSPTLAVLPFEMLGSFTSNPAAIRLTLVNLLKKTRAYHVLSDVEVQKKVESLKYVPGLGTEQQVAEVGQAIGADLVIYGNFSHAAPMFLTIFSILDTKSGKIVNSVTQPFEGVEENWLYDSLPKSLSQLTGQTLDQLMQPEKGYIALLRSRVHESIDKLTLTIDGAKLRHLPDRTDCLLITDVPEGIHTLDIEYYTFGHNSEVNGFGITVKPEEVASLKIDIMRGSDEMRLRNIFPGENFENWKLKLGAEYREFNIVTMTLDDLFN